ncbi:MAG: glycosyltransferase family 4 protein, partial [Candidatus Altiarchaeota archaeon]
LEFQACGTPIVASNAGGIPEAVVDGKTGFLSGPDDPEAFAENITRLLSNPSLRVRMGKAGVAHVKKSFSPEKCLQEYMHLYGRMLK